MNADSLRLHEGELLDHFRIDAVDAGGSIASATDQTLGRKVTVQLLPRLARLPDGVREDYAARLAAWSETVHPHLADLLALEMGTPVPYLVLDHYSGSSLAACRREPDWSPAAPSLFALGIADGLAAGLSRTGVTPELTDDNILVQEDGQPVILGSLHPESLGADASQRRALRQLGELLEQLSEQERHAPLKTLAADCLAASAKGDLERGFMASLIHRLRELAGAPMPVGLGSLEADELPDRLHGQRLHAIALACAGALSLALLALLFYVVSRT